MARRFVERTQQGTRGMIMALRRLNIDFEALARAMATGERRNDYYLDIHTGRMRSRPMSGMRSRK